MRMRIFTGMSNPLDVAKLKEELQRCTQTRKVSKSQRRSSYILVYFSIQGQTTPHYNTDERNDC